MLSLNPHPVQPCNDIQELSQVTNLTAVEILIKHHIEESP
jgi:hypothetical protein